MSITGLALTALLAVIVIAYVAYPLLIKRTSSSAFISRQRERALAYYERVLTNIRDLDEDHTTGKINAEEYEAERALWVDRGVKVLKLLDDLNENQTIVQDRSADDAAIDAAIEAAVRQRQPQEAS